VVFKVTTGLKVVNRESRKRLFGRLVAYYLFAYLLVLDLFRGDFNSADKIAVNDDRVIMN
jgi:hypothetical protein